MTRLLAIVALGSTLFALAIPAFWRWPGVGVAMVLYVAALAWTRVFPGDCYGPRYWIAWLPWLAITASESRYRRSLLALCAASAVIAIPCALRYGDLFQQPAWSALW
jgi:hypothetical protein